MQIGDLIRRAGRQLRRRARPVDGERVLTFAEFDDLTARLGMPCWRAACATATGSRC